MKIQEQDLYHGSALTQITEHNSFKALNKATPKYGHYLVNTDRHFFVKYRTHSNSPWIFPFTVKDVEALKQTIELHKHVSLCLVCGKSTICALNVEEISSLIDLENGSEGQSIRVEVPPGGSCHVSGSFGKLKKTVPHNSFPGKLFS